MNNVAPVQRVWGNIHTTSWSEGIRTEIAEFNRTQRCHFGGQPL